MLNRRSQKRHFGGLVALGNRGAGESHNRQYHAKACTGAHSAAAAKVLLFPLLFLFSPVPIASPSPGCFIPSMVFSQEEARAHGCARSGGGGRCH